MADVSKLNLGEGSGDMDIKDAKAFRTDDTASTALADADYIPFYDTSASAKKKTLWSNIKSKLASVFADKEDYTNFKQSLSDSLAYPPHRVMFVMDSYGGRTNSQGLTVAQKVSAFTGLQCDCIWESGAALIKTNDQRIIDNINNYTGDGTVYDTVIVACGANDEAAAITNWSNFPSRFQALADAINTKFPNAKNKFVACIGQTFRRDSTFSSELNRFLLLGYREYSREAGLGYIRNMEYVLRDQRFLESDLCHPNSNGIDKLGLYFSEFLRTGHVEVQSYMSATGTDQAGRSYTFYFFRTNNVVKITPLTCLWYLVNGGSTSTPIDGTYQNLITLTNSSVNCDTSGSGAFAASSNNPVIFKITSTYSETRPPFSTICGMTPIFIPPASCEAFATHSISPQFTPP